jgi:hypothetical protein
MKLSFSPIGDVGELLLVSTAVVMIIPLSRFQAEISQGIAQTS